MNLPSSEYMLIAIKPLAIAYSMSFSALAHHLLREQKHKYFIYHKIHIQKVKKAIQHEIVYTLSFRLQYQRIKNQETQVSDFMFVNLQL